MAGVPAFIVASPSVTLKSAVASSVLSSSVSSRHTCVSSSSTKASAPLRSSFVPGASAFSVSRSFSSLQKVSIPEIVAFNEEWYDRGILDSSRFPNKLETDSFYGFSKNAEQFNGRAAMLGFALGIVTEVLTGKGIFGQLGITSHADQVQMMAVLVSTWLATLIFHSLYASNKDRVDRLLKVGKYATGEDLD
mmetsp:Transcript_18639/g.30648  ORF Transcript_18639/g.30648 Transcript_18639/m.30648 type:complete len:192 (+) Transcript_18639:246-821(+)|eukprot:CAMPEP_0184656464 /NCGR_PEP_ID=MMETSP0308-20130426/16526_1 /TAXON_ID=38269 /ORGANISM="Gloeochaete witrockiana, Strain SAG 46.84" /LENGTH=191 /DNA_ID=CAMNT_0027093611 /DNA_START=77 /DNA_END=652 /DNA_ORIENTATION=-